MSVRDTLANNPTLGSTYSVHEKFTQGFYVMTGHMPESWDCTIIGVAYKGRWPNASFVNVRQKNTKTNVEREVEYTSVSFKDLILGIGNCYNTLEVSNIVLVKRVLPKKIVKPKKFKLGQIITPKQVLSKEVLVKFLDRHSEDAIKDKMMITQISCNMYALICMEDGNRWTDPKSFPLIDNNAIPQKIIESLLFEH